MTKNEKSTSYFYSKKILDYFLELYPDQKKKYMDFLQEHDGDYKEFAHDVVFLALTRYFRQDNGLDDLLAYIEKGA